MTTSQHEPKIMSTTDNTPRDQQAEAEVTAAPTGAEDLKARRKSVTFATMDVAEFEPTAWTATVASDGVPVRFSGRSLAAEKVGCALGSWPFLLFLYVCVAWSVDAGATTNTKTRGLV